MLRWKLIKHNIPNLLANEEKLQQYTTYTKIHCVK